MNKVCLLHRQTILLVNYTVNVKVVFFCDLIRNIGWNPERLEQVSGSSMRLWRDQHCGFKRKRESEYNVLCFETPDF
jgi:hypothetical protein